MSEREGRSLSASPSDREDTFRPQSRPIHPEFNRALYPGYDDLGNRRGLEHLQSQPSSQPLSGHYPSRAFNYPPPLCGTPGEASLQGHGSTRNPSNTPTSPYASLDDGQQNVTEMGSVLSALPGFPDDLGNPMNASQINHFAPQFSPHGLHTVMASPISQNSQHLSPNLQIGEVLHGEPSKGVNDSMTQDELAGVHASLGIPPDVAISLSSLKDPEPGKKPDYAYPVLMKLAILESPRKALTLQEIYEAFENRFEWFKVNQGWKVGIHTI